MARNFDLNKLPKDDVEEEMFAEVIETSFSSAKRKVPESESSGLDQTRLVGVEMFIAESRVYMAPSYAACAGPCLGFLPAGLIPYQPHARYPMHGSRIHTPNSAEQSSSIKHWGSGIVATKSTGPGLHDAESSTNEPARKGQVAKYLKCFVESRALPTLKNVTINIAESILDSVGFSHAKKTELNILYNISGISK